MKLLAALTFSLALVPSPGTAQSATTTIPASGGDITITAIQHASVQIEQGGKVIQVDPAQGDFASALSLAHQQRLPRTRADIRKGA